MLTEKIRALCAESGITINKLEHEVGLGNGVIGKWANSSPSVANLKKVADRFGITIDELMKEA